MKKYRFIRFIYFGHLFEFLFVSAILTIFGIRLYLQLTRFPQIGSGEFHIAHLLFGGFFMLASIIGFITYLNNDLKPYWAVLGGIGFGTFIDELGKFITRDNNYFFQPTIAIIYVIFIALYFVYKNLERNHNFTKDEYLVNSISLLQDFVIKHFDSEEKEDALEYLTHSEKTQLSNQLIKIFSESGALPHANQNLYEKIKTRLTAAYHFFLGKPWFLHAVAFFFIIRSIFYLVTGVFLITAIIKHISDGTLAQLADYGGILPLIQFFALTIQAILTILGALIIVKSRKKAYIFFKNSVIISIFIIQVFAFYNNPIQALFTTTGDLLLLGVLNYMIKEEK